MQDPSPRNGGSGYEWVMDGTDSIAEELYVEFADELVLFACGLVGATEAPDVVADAFLRLVSSSVWASARNPRALWYRAVLYEARTTRRSNARRHRREERFAPAEAVDTCVSDIEVLDAIALLTPQQRAVIMLTYWQDLPPGSIADLLGVSDGSVRKQLARARKKLREELT